MSDQKSQPGTGSSKDKDKDNQGQQKKDDKSNPGNHSGAGLPPYPPD